LPQDLEYSGSEDSLPQKEQKSREAKRNAFWEQNRVVPKIFESKDSTPVELAVEKKNTNLTIELSKY